MNRYQYWTDALAGKKPPMYVDDPMPGFYRKGTYERNDKGNKKRTGWEPVAIFMNGDNLAAVVGAGQFIHITDRDKINELWSYCCANPISEEWYRAVAERSEPWPDAHDASKNKATPAILDPVPDVEQKNEENIAKQIAQAKMGVSQYDKIDSDEMAGRALSLKNTLTALAGDLNKHREALVRPHIDAQKAVNDRLNPIINDAKASSAALLRAMGAWNDTKREAAKAAEISGQPANAPAPYTQVAAAVGRKASVSVKSFVDTIDLDLAYAHFKYDRTLTDLLHVLCQKAVDAGVHVPGVVTVERSVVK